MNLHGIVSGAVGTVNPQVPISIQVSTGNTVSADYSRAPGYATPGSVTASIGATFTATTTGTTLNVSAIAAGIISVGDTVTGTDGTNSLPAGTNILAQLTGPPGGIGTYTLSAAAAPANLSSAALTSTSTVLNVTAVSAGTVQPGQTLSGAGLTAGTIITENVGGTGDDGTYLVNQPQTVAPVTMTSACVVLGQVQAMTFRDLQQVEGLNLNGTRRSIYLNGTYNGIVRVQVKGGDLMTLPDGSVYLVAQVLEQWPDWVKVAVTLQNGQ